MQDYEKLYDTYVSFRGEEAEPGELQEAQEALEKALHVLHNPEAMQAIDLAVGRVLRLHDIGGFALGCSFMRDIRSVLETR